MHIYRYIFTQIYIITYIYTYIVRRTKRPAAGRSAVACYPQNGI